MGKCKKCDELHSEPGKYCYKCKGLNLMGSTSSDDASDTEVPPPPKENGKSKSKRRDMYGKSDIAGSTRGTSDAYHVAAGVYGKAAASRTKVCH